MTYILVYEKSLKEEIFTVLLTTTNVLTTNYFGGAKPLYSGTFTLNIATWSPSAIAKVYVFLYDSASCH